MIVKNQIWRFWVLLMIVVMGGALVHWRENSGEDLPPRRLLRELPENLGAWQKIGSDARFDPEIESVLRADDYLLRDYYSPAVNKTANVYVGYYNTQRTGATYHSPRNCLPGSGWTMREPEAVKITLPGGREFNANSYVIENETEKMLMIYWYQGRGRFVADEYTDKLLTIWDSVRLRRSDGALVRVVTTLDNSETEALLTASDLAAQTAVNLTDFVPN